MTTEAKRALKKRLVELLLAAITALIAALSTSCAVRWSANSFDVEWKGVSTPGPSTNAVP